MTSNKTTGDKSPIIVGDNNKIIYSEDRINFKLFNKVSDLGVFFEDISDKDIINYKLVSYYGWHEVDDDWLKGNGELIAVTFDEIGTLWDNRDVIYDYDANVLRFKLNGGRIDRVFVINGAYLQDAISFGKFCRVVYRHEFLGMRPKIVSRKDINRVRNIVGTHCHSVGTLNGNLGYFFYNQSGMTPEILRTTCKKDIKRINKAIFEIKPLCYDALKWLKNYKKYDVDESILVDAEKDAEIVSYLSTM